MKVRKIILIFIIFISVFINCNVYAEFEDNFDTDVTLNEIYDPNAGYNYDLIWDDMKFIYTENKSFVYDSDTHDYNLVVNEYWSDTNNKVSMTNNSVNKINVSLLYKSGGTYNNVIGTFTPNNFILKYNETKESKLELDGKINKTESEFFTIGTITINVQ